jgi:hypothetical protein
LEEGTLYNALQHVSHCINCCRELCCREDRARCYTASLGKHSEGRAVQPTPASHRSAAEARQASALFGWRHSSRWLTRALRRRLLRRWLLRRWLLMRRPRQRRQLLASRDAMPRRRSVSPADLLESSAETCSVSTLHLGVGDEHLQVDLAEAEQLRQRVPALLNEGIGVLRQSVLRQEVLDSSGRCVDLGRLVGHDDFARDSVSTWSALRCGSCIIC